jgi:gas vesicle protein
MSQHTPSCTSPVGFLLYFLAGSVAGASVALLLAPHSGRATRELMRRKMRDTANSTRELKHQLVDRGRRLRDEATDRVDDVVSALAGNGGAKLEG